MPDDLAIMRHKCGPHLKRCCHDDAIGRVAMYVFGQKTAADRHIDTQRMDFTLAVSERIMHPLLAVSVHLKASLGDKYPDLPTGNDAYVKALPVPCGVNHLYDIIV
jgi:hypothetical protein